jgi:hypothetical protein
VSGIVGAKVKGRAVEGGAVRADQAGQTGRGLSIRQLLGSVPLQNSTHGL